MGEADGAGDQEYISPGGEDEAADYAALAGPWWAAQPEALAWLEASSRADK